MKKIILLLVLVVAICAGGTYLVSENSELVFDKNLTKLNAFLERQKEIKVLIEKVSYQKGFLSNKVKTKLTIGVGSLGQDEYLVDHTVYNGPVMLTPNGIKVGLSHVYSVMDWSTFPAEVQTEIKSLFSGNAPFSFQTTMGFNNNIVVIGDMLAHDVVDDGEISYSFGGLQSVFNLKNDSSFHWEMTLGKTEIVDKGANSVLTLSESVADVVVTDFYHGSIVNGVSSIKMPLITLKSERDDLDVILSGLNINTDIGADDKDDSLLKSLTNFDLDQLSADAKVLEKPHLELEFGGMTKVAYMGLIDAVNMFNTEAINALAASSDDSEEAVKQVVKAVDELIQLGSYFKMAGNAYDEAGLTHSDIALMLKYNSNESLINQAKVRDVVGVLQGEVNASFDKKMLAGTALEFLMGYGLATGVMVEDEGAYNTEIQLEKSQLMINSEAWPLMDMLGPIADNDLPWTLLGK